MRLFWVSQAIAFWSLAIFLIPIKFFKKFFLFAFLGGFVYTWIVQLIAVGLFEIWYYKPDVLTVLGIPVFFVFSWFAVTSIYGFLLFQYPKYQLWILLFFVLFTTLINYLAYKRMVLFMPNWGTLETFMFAVFSHIILLYFLKFLYKIDDLGTKKNTIGFSLSAIKKN